MSEYMKYVALRENLKLSQNFNSFGRYKNQNLL